MDHYIIKIYRKELQTTPQQIAGTVENLADQHSRNFDSADELVAILVRSQGRRQDIILDDCRNPGIESEKC